MPRVTLDLPNPASSQRVMKAMRQMDKIDNGGLKRAYAGD